MNQFWSTEHFIAVYLHVYLPLRRLLYFSTVLRTDSVTAAGDVNKRYKSTSRRRRLPAELTSWSRCRKNTNKRAPRVNDVGDVTRRAMTSSSSLVTSFSALSVSTSELKSTVSRRPVALTAAAWRRSRRPLYTVNTRTTITGAGSLIITRSTCPSNTTSDWIVLEATSTYCCRTPAPAGRSTDRTTNRRNVNDNKKWIWRQQRIASMNVRPVFSRSPPPLAQVRHEALIDPMLTTSCRHTAVAANNSLVIPLASVINHQHQQLNSNEHPDVIGHVAESTRVIASSSAEAAPVTHRCSPTWRCWPPVIITYSQIIKPIVYFTVSFWRSRLASSSVLMVRSAMILDALYNLTVTEVIIGPT